MRHNSTHNTIDIQALSPSAFAPFGWMLGKPFPTGEDAAAFRSPASDFWSEHLFDPGPEGEEEVLWVSYRDTNPIIGTLEAHSLTQQAVVPLTAEIIQILATSNPDGSPDLTTLSAFRLFPGIGVCMRPGSWHATRAVSNEATCLMLTRRSTTADLISHLNHGRPATASAFAEIPPVRLCRPAADR